MRKFLLATSTMVAVSLAAGSAGAAEKIKLQLGGYMQQYFGGFGSLKDSSNGKARDGLGIDTETRVYVQGETVLDNGLTVGAFISFIGEAHTGDSDQNVEYQYLYLKGDFGAAYAGEVDGVFDRFAVRAPNVGGRTGQDIQEWLKYADGTTTNYIPTLDTTLDDASPRVSYITPNWHGLSLGVSFAPNSEIGKVRGVRVREGREGSNEFQVGLAFDNHYRDIGIRADGSFSKTIDGVDRWAYRAGLALTYGGWTVGGSYMGTQSDSDDRGWVHNRHGSTGQNHAFDENIWEAGVSYELGQYGVSFTYAQNDSDWGNASTYQVGGSYKLGPGVTAVSNLFYAENNQKGYSDYRSEKYPNGLDNTYRSGIGAIAGMILEF